jgi:hypothetical protein
VAGQPRSFRRLPSGALAAAWFVGLALVVAGPLLGGGHLILLDFPAGPEFPPVSLFPLPSSGDVGNTLPILAAYAALRELWTPLPEKLILVVPIVVGGLGLYRLARGALGLGAPAAVFGGTLFVVSPFVHDRYQVGHLYFVLAFALLPWALSPLVGALRGPIRRDGLVSGLWLAGLGAISVHVAGVYALLLVIFAAAAAGRALARLAFATRALALGVVLSAYWLLPFLAAPERDVGTGDLEAFETRPDGFRVVPVLLTLYGFWRRELGRPVDDHPWLFAFAVPILALVVAGAVLLLRDGAHRRLGAALGVASVLGVLLAAGTAFPPTSAAFRWAFTNIPSLGAFREPQKFLALTVVAYALFAAFALERLLRTRRVLLLAAPAAVAVVLVYGHALLWGIGGIELSRYPASWSQANRIMAERGEGKLAVLPWWLYEDWPYTDGRIVASPAPSYFSGREVLVGRDIGLGLPSSSVDPFSFHVDDALDVDGLRDLGRRLAPLGVRFVAWTEEAEPEDLELLARQRDLRRVYDGGDLVLFESRAWVEGAIGLDAVAERDPFVGAVGDPDLPLVDRLPGWRTVTPQPQPVVSVGERCNDGWRLGADAARCHLGAVAAFPGPSEPTRLWRPFAVLQAWGVAVTLVALGWVVVQLRRSRHGEGRAVPGLRATRRFGGPWG